MAQTTHWQDTADENFTWPRYLQSLKIEHFGIGLGVLALIIFIVGYFDQYTILSIRQIFEDFYANVSSELISIVITVLVLEGFYERRQNAQELTRLKALLGSNENVVTKIAIAELKAKGWLEDGSLQGANLWRSGSVGRGSEGGESVGCDTEGSESVGRVVGGGESVGCVVG